MVLDIQNRKYDSLEIFSLKYLFYFILFYLIYFINLVHYKKYILLV
jgi:hypothetical protein